MADGYVLSEATAGRLKKLLADGGGAPVERGPAARGRLITLVRCMSATPAGGGGAGAIAYPGRVILDGPADTSPAEVGDVWLTIWGDNDIPAIPRAGRHYLAVLADYLDIGGVTRQRAFATATIADLPGPGSGLTGSGVSGSGPSGWTGSGWSGMPSGVYVSGVFLSGPFSPGGTATVYRTVCASDSFLKSYRSTVTLSAGRIVQSEWELAESLCVACSCPDPCFGADPLEAAAAVEPDSGYTPLTVSLDMAISGGISPYTVTVDWGDGTTEEIDSGDLPLSHEYESEGVYLVSVSVTDDCDRTVSDSAVVTVAGEVTCLDCDSPGVFCVTTTGGSGEDNLNGSRQVPFSDANLPACFWEEGAPPHATPYWFIENQGLVMGVYRWVLWYMQNPPTNTQFITWEYTSATPDCDLSAATWAIASNSSTVVTPPTSVVVTAGGCP